jgi:integrase
MAAKPSPRPKHVWSIRTKLQMADRKRDLALFNLAIDSKLRGCDVVALKVEDIAPHGYAVDRATMRQKKTGRPVRFELTELTLTESRDARSHMTYGICWADPDGPSRRKHRADHTSKNCQPKRLPKQCRRDARI